MGLPSVKPEWRGQRVGKAPVRQVIDHAARHAVVLEAAVTLHERERPTHLSRPRLRSSYGIERKAIRVGDTFYDEELLFSNSEAPNRPRRGPGISASRNVSRRPDLCATSAQSSRAKSMTARPAVGYFLAEAQDPAHVALADEKPRQFLEAGIVADHHTGFGSLGSGLAHDLQKPADRRFVDPPVGAHRDPADDRLHALPGLVRPPRRGETMTRLGRSTFPLQVVGHHEGCLPARAWRGAGRDRARRRAMRPWRGGGAGDGASVPFPSGHEGKLLEQGLASCSFLSSAPCSGGMQLAGSRSRSVSGPISSDSSSLSQSSSSEVEGFFFRPGTSRTSKKMLERLLDQPMLDAGKVDFDDRAHRLGIGELDVVEEAAAQEGVRQFLLVVGGDDQRWGAGVAWIVSPVS